MLSPRSIPRPRPLSQLVRHALVGLGALFFATAVYAQATPENAQAVDYTVRIDAPRALEELLEDNLDLMRWRGNARVDLEQLQRLVKEAPEQARTLIATEGYYSPKVSAGLETSGARPVARVIVDPGQPVLVGDVDLVLQGFVPFEEGGAPFDANALRNRWTLPVGSQFRQADWESAKSGLLRDKGTILAADLISQRVEKTGLVVGQRSGSSRALSAKRGLEVADHPNWPPAMTANGKPFYDDRYLVSGRLEKDLAALKIR